MAKIALAYDSIDRERVRPFYESLIKKGYIVFWDQNIIPGDNWNRLLRHNFKEALCVLVFLSNTSVESLYVLDEAASALRSRKHIPVLLDALQPDDLPAGYGATQAITVPAGGPTAATWHSLDVTIKDIVSALPWVAELVYPFRSRISELEEKVDAYEATVSDLNDELQGVKKVIVDAIDKAERKGLEVKNSSADMRETLQLLKSYLNLSPKKPH